MSRHRSVLAVACLLALAPGGAVGGADDLAFARRIAVRFQNVLPGYHVTIVDPMTLDIDRAGSRPGQDKTQADLNRLSGFCRRAPDRCEQETEAFIARMVDFIRQPVIPLRRADLVAVVRPLDYALQYSKDLKAQRAPIFETLVGNLVMLCYFDAPTTLRLATTAQAASIGLTPRDALALCKANMRTRLKPIPAEALDMSQVNLIQGDSFASSYLALHDAWTAVAAKAHGKLLVATPDDQSVVFIVDTGPDSMAEFSKVVAALFRRGERPLSAQVFRWTPIGWDVAAP